MAVNEILSGEVEVDVKLELVLRSVQWQKVHATRIFSGSAQTLDRNFTYVHKGR